MNSPPIREQTAATRAIQLIPFMSGATALASPAGMSVYWVTNAFLSLAQSVGARNKLRAEGLDMWEMDRLQREDFEKEAKMIEQQKARLEAQEAERKRQQAERERRVAEKAEKAFAAQGKKKSKQPEKDKEQAGQKAVAGEAENTKAES